MVDMTDRKAIDAPLPGARSSRNPPTTGPMTAAGALMALCHGFVGLDQRFEHEGR